MKSCLTVAVDFSFPSSSGVQATLRSATNIVSSAAVQTIRNTITPRMEQVTQCVTSPAFCNALAEVSTQYGSGANMPQAQTYLRGILTSDNLRRRGVPVPTGSTIRADLNIAYRIDLIYPPLSVRFNYPEQLTHGHLPV